MPNTPVSLVPVADHEATRDLEAALAVVGCSPVIIPVEDWLNARNQRRFPYSTVLLFGRRRAASTAIHDALQARRMQALAIFQSGAAIDPRIAAQCCDFLCWPCASDELALRLERLRGPEPVADENILIDEFAELNLVGASPAFLGALRTIKKIARCDAPALIEGETGTGKELAARAIHYLGARRDHPFIPVNCGALPDQLLENELFGHERGAYTDAREVQPGVVQLAEGGTLFLDEIDALSPKAQVALLRFLQDRQYRPLGAKRVHTANVRVVAASNTDLSQLTQQHQFRQDLLYRLNVVPVRLPPLRERGADVELLARHFIQRFARHYQQPEKSLHLATVDALRRYPWPGNVRELENTLHRAFILADGDVVRLPALLGEEGERRRSLVDRRQAALLQRDLRAAKARLVAEFERHYLEALLHETHGNVSEAARRAGKERRALGKLIKKHGLTGRHTR
jgi:DNA-binding NtrC family response regulator